MVSAAPSRGLAGPDKPPMSGPSHAAVPSTGPATGAQPDLVRRRTTSPNYFVGSRRSRAADARTGGSACIPVADNAYVAYRSLQARMSAELVAARDRSALRAAPAAGSGSTARPSGSPTFGSNWHFRHRRCRRLSVGLEDRGVHPALPQHDRCALRRCRADARGTIGRRGRRATRWASSRWMSMKLPAVEARYGFTRVASMLAAMDDEPDFYKPFDFGPETRRRRHRLKEPCLEGAHRGLLGGFGVVPAADVERAVGRQEAQLVGRRTSARRRSGRRGRPRPARSRARPRSRCRRGAADDRAAAGTSRSVPVARSVAPGCAGNASGGSSGNDSTSVGPVLPRCVGVELGQLGVVGQDQPDRGRRRCPAADGRRDGTAELAPATGEATRRDRQIGAPRPRATGPVEVDPPRARGRAPGSRCGAAASAAAESLRSPTDRRRPPRAATPARRPCSAGTRCGVWYIPSSCPTNASRIRSRSRSVRSHSSNWPSAIRSSMIRVTIARIAGSSREASDRTDASTPSASMSSAASRDCGLGPACRNLRSSTDRAGPCQLLGPGVEVAHDRRPVVLRDERDQRLRQPRLVGQVDAVDHVLLEDPGADLRVELVVDVVAAGLVLDERERVRELADVVVVRRHAGHQRIGADRLGGALGEVADHQRVVVRARRLDQEPAQQRLRRVRELEQLEDGQDPEHRSEHRERADRRDPRTRRRGRRGEPQLEDAAQVAGAEQREDRHDQRVDDEDRDRRLDEHLEPVARAGRRRCRPSRRGRCRS